MNGEKIGEFVGLSLLILLLLAIAAMVIKFIGWMFGIA